MGLMMIIMAASTSSSEPLIGNQPADAFLSLLSLAARCFSKTAKRAYTLRD